MIDMDVNSALLSISGVTGGSGISGVSPIKQITLEEPVRAVQLDIPSDYDWAYVLIDGSFVESDWLYWEVNTQTSNIYTDKIADINVGLAVTNYNNKYSVFGPNRTDQYFLRNSGGTVQYFYIYGYSKDFDVGTRFTLFGGKYANM